jgi:hypothetical protein
MTPIANYSHTRCARTPRPTQPWRPSLPCTHTFWQDSRRHGPADRAPLGLEDLQGLGVVGAPRAGHHRVFIGGEVMMRSSSSTQGGSSVLPGMVKTSTFGFHETDREAIRLTSTCGFQLTVREGDLGAALRRKQWCWAAMRPLGPWDARSCSFLLHVPASVERMSSDGIVRACNCDGGVSRRFTTLAPNSTKGSGIGTSRGRQCSRGRGVGGLLTASRCNSTCGRYDNRQLATGQGVFAKNTLVPFCDLIDGRTDAEITRSKRGSRTARRQRKRRTYPKE